MTSTDVKFENPSKLIHFHKDVVNIHVEMPAQIWQHARIAVASKKRATCSFFGPNFNKKC